MNNYRKWILCGAGWLLLYVYFDPRLFTFFIHTVWRLWSMSSEERHFWQPEIHVLAAFGFAALVWYVLLALAYCVSEIQKEVKKCAQRRYIS
jgi:hypothetical protein